MYILVLTNRISGVMVSVLASNVVDREFESSPVRVKPKNIKLVFAASQLKTHH